MAVSRGFAALNGAAKSTRIADEAASYWRAVEAALSPIVGSQGVAALYRRSCFLSAAKLPWLACDPDPVLPPFDLVRLHALLSSQEPADAEAGAALLRQNFLELLASLIGASLAQRLLGPLAFPSTIGPAAQETSS